MENNSLGPYYFDSESLRSRPVVHDTTLFCHEGAYKKDETRDSIGEQVFQVIVDKRNRWNRADAGDEGAGSSIFSAPTTADNWLCLRYIIDVATNQN